MSDKKEVCIFCNKSVGEIGRSYGTNRDYDKAHSDCIMKQLKKVLSFNVRLINIQKIIDELTN